MRAGGAEWQRDAEAISRRRAPAVPDPERRRPRRAVRLNREAQVIVVENTVKANPRDSIDICDCDPLSAAWRRLEALAAAAGCAVAERSEENSQPLFKGSTANCWSHTNRARPAPEETTVTSNSSLRLCDEAICIHHHSIAKSRRRSARVRSGLPSARLSGGPVRSHCD
jgi:hypothetical protein